MHRLVYALFVISSLWIDAAAGELEIFISANGNDGWSGKTKIADPEAKNAPVASVVRGLELIREARENDPAARITVSFLPGRYELSEPITITTAETGRQRDASLTLAAEGGEVVLSGGRRITGWKRSASNANVWETEIPEVREGQWFFRQLFVNGNRKTRARTPNNGFFRIDGPSPQDKPARLKFRNNDIKREWATGGIEVIGLFAWADIRMQIRAVDEEKQDRDAIPESALIES